VLIESLLHVEDPRLEVWIAGSDKLDPHYAAELRELVVRRGLSSRVRFLGPVPYREILRYYRERSRSRSRRLKFGRPMVERCSRRHRSWRPTSCSARSRGHRALYFRPTTPSRFARAADSLARRRSEEGPRRARPRARRVHLEAVGERPVASDEVLAEEGRGRAA
jgi:hypothetical protein